MVFNENIPIYIQIMNNIKEKILIGELQLNERIPAVRAYAEEYNVNQNTIQRVCTELEREGIIYTQRGIGSFVTQDSKIIDKLKRQKKKEIIETFLDGMKKLGFDKEEIVHFVEEEF